MLYSILPTTQLRPASGISFFHHGSRTHRHHSIGTSPSCRQGTCWTKRSFHWRTTGLQQHCRRKGNREATARNPPKVSSSLGRRDEVGHCQLFSISRKSPLLTSALDMLLSNHSPTMSTAKMPIQHSQTSFETQLLSQTSRLRSALRSAAFK